MNNSSNSADTYLMALPAWQAEKLSQFRTLIHDVSHDMSEDIKWGVPAFSVNSTVIFTMAAFKNHVKYNFIANGARLNDSKKLFNNGLESAKSRSIDLTEDQSVDQNELKNLIQQAIEL